MLTLPNINNLKTYLIIGATTVLLATTTSCLGVKKSLEEKSNTRETEKVETIKDSSSSVETNKAIEDRVIINVPKSDNKEVTVMFERLMQQLNTSKSSGTNSYNMRYDAETRQLLLDFMVGQTQNKELATNSDVKTESTFEEMVETNTKKVVRMIPWWIWLVLGIWFLPQIITRVAMITNPLIALAKKNT